MIRKFSKKKIYSVGKKTSKKNRKKLFKKHKKNRKKYKLLGGSENPKNEDNQLETSIRKVLREENNLSNTKPTKKKGLIGRLVSSLPLVGNLLKEPEHLQVIETQDKLDKIKAKELEREVAAETSSGDKFKGEVANSIKQSMQGVTERRGSSLMSTLTGRVKKMYTKKCGDVVDTIAGPTKKVAQTAKEVKLLATQRQCDSQFITGLDTLLNTCSKEEVINVYNEVVNKVKSKKHFFSPRLKEEIETLKILNYNTKKEFKIKPDIRDLDITPEDSNTISKLQNNIDTQLDVKNKMSQLQKKTKKNKKTIINTKISNESNESKV